MLTLMGFIFGWFLLARFLLNISTRERDNAKNIKQLIHNPSI